MNRYLIEIVRVQGGHFIVEADSPEDAVQRHINNYPSLYDKTFHVTQIGFPFGEYKLSPRKVEFKADLAKYPPQDSSKMPNTEQLPPITDDPDDIPF